jgi:hypothetical protein
VKGRTCCYPLAIFFWATAADEAYADGPHGCSSQEDLVGVVAAVATAHLGRVEVGTNDEAAVVALWASEVEEDETG